MDKCVYFKMFLSNCKKLVCLSPTNLICNYLKFQQRYFFTFLILLLFSPPLQAQTLSDSTYVYMFPNITVWAKKPFSNLPLASTFISKETIRWQTVNNTADLLTSVVGLNITRYGDNGARFISIRGSTADQVLILLDGIPLNSLTSGDADLSSISSSSIESIQI